MPTSRPRYTVTDTGELERTLDLAERAWPEAGSRKELLDRVLAAGREVLEQRMAAEAAKLRRDRQRAALRRAPELVDADALLGDAAWR
jgi:DNA-binding FadR family transcriptional regulator